MVIWRTFLWQLWWWVLMTNENHCLVSCALSFSCVWILCFEIFRCLFCALMTQILRIAAPRKVKWGSTIPSLGFSFCRFVITPGSLNHCLWIRSQHGNQSRIVLVSKLAAHGCAGFPPQHPLEFSAPHLHHLGWHSNSSIVFGRLWPNWSQDLCGWSVHVQDNYPSGRLTHQIAHIWGHIIQLGWPCLALSPLPPLENYNHAAFAMFNWANLVVCINIGNSWPP